jgi:glycerol kinase
MYARGTITGITRGVTANHIIRAAEEAIAYQVCDLVRAMEKDAGLSLAGLKVDGGASRDSFLLQFQADVSDFAIRRPVLRETTAAGAAFLAGLAAGIWSGLDELRKIWQLDAEFKPAMEDAKRSALLDGWHKAVKTAMYAPDSDS